MRTRPTASLCSILIAGALASVVACGGKVESTPNETEQTTTTPGRPSAPPGAVSVSAQDLGGYVPSMIVVEAGKPVTLFILNDSSNDHEIASDIPVSGLTYFHADNDPAAQAVSSKSEAFDVAFQVGGWAQVTFTPTQSGLYEFHCTVPGHTDKGAFMVSSGPSRPVSGDRSSAPH
jgi:uncharacterized cupredoxin-like copper-binding protein